MKAVHLQTEKLTSPLGIGSPAPRFSWICEDGVTQTAYRIACKREGRLVWESGKVESARMTWIRYEGEPLRSRDRVEWSVTLWDENGDPGEESSAWFELGLLWPTDFTAEWITGDYKPKRIPVIRWTASERRSASPEKSSKPGFTPLPEDCTT